MKTKIVLCLFILLSILTGCTNEEPREELPQSKRTILVYMIASDLGTDLNGNIDDMISVATAKNLKGGNLIVFYSKNKQEAELFQIKEGGNGVVTKHHIKNYENQSAISPQVMREVINEVKSLFPSDSYGMILSSHGTSWMPSDYRTMLRYFGDESGNNMEITELAEAIPDDAFDFLLFDACSMGGIECVYELKDKTDYIVASPSETMRAGFPYKIVLPYLFEYIANLDKVAEEFYNFYEAYNAPYGNVAVTKTSELDKLVAITKEIISTAGEEKLYSLPYSELQTLSYLSYSPTKLFDFDNVIDKLATSDQYVHFSECMKNAVTSKYHTPQLYCSKGGVMDVNRFCGLSVYPPQVKLTQLNDWYKQLKWYQAVYQ